MMFLDSVSKSYGRSAGQTVVLDGITAELDRDANYVVLGRRGAGKSTFLRILSGLETPTRGSITRDGMVSMPVGSASTIATGRTGKQLATFLASLYRADPREIVRFVAAFTGLEDALDHPVADLPPAARLRFNYALGYAIPADLYLFDDSIGTGEAEFRRKCQSAFDQRRQTAGTIVTLRDVRQARALGDRAAILHAGKLYLFKTVAEAVSAYRGLDLQNGSRGVLRARELIATGAHPAARDYLKHHLSEHKNDLEGYRLFAELSLQNGFEQDTLHAAKAILEMDSHSARAHYMVALVSERQENLPAAVASAEEASRIDPKNRAYGMLLARVLEKSGSNTQAAAIWRGLAPQDRDSRDLRFAIRNDVKAGNWAIALADARLALKDQPDEVGLLTTAATALLELERWDEAKDSITRLAAADAEKAIEVLYRLARTPHWPHMIGMLHALPPAHRDPSVDRPDAVPLTVARLATFLEEKRDTALEQGDTPTAEGIRRALESMVEAGLTHAVTPEPRKPV